MDTELFALRHRRRAPDTAGEWIALILAIAASVAVDSLLKKNFPDMAPRVRKGLSSIPTIAILLIYFFVIKK
ncbi:MAG: hypothetical protein ACI4RG_13340 [Huintestinicola sp.]